MLRLAGRAGRLPTTGSILGISTIAALALISGLSASGDGDVTSLRTEAAPTTIGPDGATADRDPLVGEDRLHLQPLVVEAGGTSAPATTMTATSLMTTTTGDGATARGEATEGSASSSAGGDSTPATTSTKSGSDTSAGPPPTAGTTTTAPAPRSTTSPTTAPACSGGGEFERVFRDDFDGSSVGPAWNQYDSPGNRNFGLRRPSAISVSGGRLIITAEMRDGSLVSGGMAHLYDQTYGKYVAKVRLDEDPSVAVSGVILTWPQSQVHPRDGENNIYETLVYDADRNPFYSFIHKPYGTHSDHTMRIHNADATRFQTMTMEWTPDRITIIREGPGGANHRESWTLKETAEDWVPDVPHHLTVQLDAWKHSIGSTVRMEVDFVEVYRYCG